jgi:hypothetical protein
MTTGDVRNLDGGTLTQMYDTVFRLDWKSGDSLTVYDVDGQYLDWTVGLHGGPGSVRGLLGSDTGQANDFQLRDGTVLTRPSDDEIATTYADSWRVAPGASLLDDAQAPALAQLVQAMSANLVPAGSGSDGQGVMQQDPNAQNPIAPSLLHH